MDHSDEPGGQTIWAAVKPIVDRTGDVSLIDSVEVGELSLLPGDIRLFEYEEFLSEAWTDCFKRRLGGLRATTSISDLLSGVAAGRAFDFIFYDTGPNIGALNRILLLDSDFFIVPVACDLFSVRALSTLGETLKRWILDARTIASLAPDGAGLLGAEPRLLGYVPQRFKMYGQAMAREPARYLQQIRQRIYEKVAAVLRSIDPALASGPSVDPVIGQVKDFASLVQTAQREGVPLWECSSAYTDQKDLAQSTFLAIARFIIDATSPKPKAGPSRGR